MSEYIGQRVHICCVEPPMRQPHPEHNGKKGTITDFWPVRLEDEEFNIPVITLDDGTVLKGYDCWWEPIDEQKEKKEN